MKKLTTEEWVDRMRLIYGDRFTYEKAIYNGSHSKVIITCKKHGDFVVETSEFARGRDCLECLKEKRINNNNKEFLEKANKIHNNKYEYKIVGDERIITVICPTHGEFKQDRFSHLNGCGCNKCYHESRENGNKDLTKLTNIWIKKAKKIHGDKYDYSKSVYTRAKDNIIITCKKHGDFITKPDYHLSGKGCPICSKENMKKKFLLTKEEVVDRFNEIHNNKYEYIGEYFGMHKKMKMLCKIHGEFEMTPSNHLSGKGCPICGKIKNIENNTMTTEEFINRCHNVHGDKYDYSNTVYNGWGNKFEYICHKQFSNGKEHGIIKQLPSVHLLHKCGCPICGNIISNAENEIAKFVGKFVSIRQNVRNILSNNREIDIYIPSLNIGIEYNGMHWHSEQNLVNSRYHLDKLNECNSIGIKLIQIFECEYLNKKDIVLSKIKHSIHYDLDLEKVYARKCYIKQIDKNVAKEFLENNHIQGFGGGTIHIGCFKKDNNCLIGVMSFLLKEKNNLLWELNRFATDINKRCIGVGGKLFNYFLENNEFDTIISFADRRWTTNIDDNLYTKLGFIVDSLLPPDYRYTKTSNDYIHKFNFRKQKLHKKYGFPLSMTESEMAKELGYYKIWNCGLIKYKYTKFRQN